MLICLVLSLVLMKLGYYADWGLNPPGVVTDLRLQALHSRPILADLSGQPQGPDPAGDSDHQHFQGPGRRDA